MARMTKEDALAQQGESVDVAPLVTFPRVNSADGEVEAQTFYRDLIDLMTGRPRLDAVHPKPIVFMEDFVTGGFVGADPATKFSETANGGEWLVTIVDGDADGAEVVGTPADVGTVASGQGGWGTFTTNDKQAGELVSCQLNGESFKLAIGKPLYFETRFAVEDITETQVFIGLSDTSTDPYAAGLGANNHAGFMLDEDGNLDFSIDEAGTQDKNDTEINFTDGSLATLETADVVHRCGFYWDGVDTIRVYVDGAEIAATGFPVVDNATTILVPDGTCLTPTIHVEADGATPETIWVDYIRVVQAR